MPPECRTLEEDVGGSVIVTGSSSAPSCSGSRSCWPLGSCSWSSDLDADVFVIGHDFHASRANPAAESRQIVHEKRRVRLARRAELRLDAEVDVHLAGTGEPAPATTRERYGLVDFGQAKQAAVKLARQRLAALGHGQLHVIQADHVRCRQEGGAGCHAMIVPSSQLRGSS